MSAKAIAIYITCANPDEAKALATKLVENKLAACCNIYPQIESIYLWQGKICTAQESVLLVKTLENKFSEIEKLIVTNHGYETPCIAAFEIAKLNDNYKQWLESSLGEDYRS
jgi:periplasmic divalent cation tolerance protein